VATSVTSPKSSLTPEQVAQRRTYIGGSDAAAVLGVDPYRTPLDIYQVKIGEKEANPPNAAMKRGIVLEPIARRLYAELTGRKVRHLRQRIHPAYPFIGCLVDGEIVGGGDQRGRGVLEIKCPGVWAFAKIKREGLPLSYIVQMQHNLNVTGFRWGSFVLFSADLWELIHFDVARDEELLQAITLKEIDFWLNHVQVRVPPSPITDTTPELMAALARAEGLAGNAKLIVRNDGEWAEGARMYLEAKEIAETGEHLLETAKERLKELMGEKGAVEGAALRCYWSDRDGRVTFDRKALERAKPLDREKVFGVVAALAAQLISPGPHVAEAFNGCELDLSTFEKRGKPYEDFRAYPLRSVGVGD
jgi:putative phage-type endonuclease